MDRERKAFDVAILDVSRVDEIDDAARALLSGMSAALRTQGKDGYLVDPNGIVSSSAPELEAVRYRTVDDAVTAARVAVRGGLSG
jgi:glutaminase